MLVMIDRNDGWGLSFGSQEWNLLQGEQIPLSMTFDGQNPWLIGLFRGAYQMQIQARGRVYAFNLGGTSRLMIQLAQCVATQMAVERGEPPPSFPNTAPATTRPMPATNPQPTLTTDVRDQELTAARIASNLLLEAKLPNARLLGAGETPPGVKGRGVAWTSDYGLGAVWLIPASVAADPQQAASQLISSDAASCKGEFASGRSSELVDDKLITKAFTGCNDSAGTHTYRYFIMQRPGSQFVIFELAGSTMPGAGDSGQTSRETAFQTAAAKAAFSQ